MRKVKMEKKKIAGKSCQWKIGNGKEVHDSACLFLYKTGCNSWKYRIKLTSLNPEGIYIFRSCFLFVFILMFI
jgi:hypothetical protein